ncbi:MAG: hypothetical protein HYT31_00370 [Parcubacteria group bacterium]|nr:hypothetical protein [Parcubacteria group bacterium]
MHIEIDQSGKIEHTSKTTVIAYANGSSRSLQISASEKQKLIRTMKTNRHPKTTYVYTIFATLIFMLLRDMRASDSTSVTIDREYPGKEPTIKNFLLQLYRKAHKKSPAIRFDTIGKKSMAHKAALAVFQNKKRPDIIVTAQDALQTLYER